MRRKLCVLALLLIACSGETLDVGNDTEGAGSTTGAGGSGSTVSGPELPDWPSVESCPVTGESNPAYVGIWDGAVEDFFLNPLTRVRLEITRASLDGVCGSLTWGFGTDPPRPLTDPNESGTTYGQGGYPGTDLHEGVTYTILQGAAREDMLRIRISQAEVWRDFCEAQEQTYYAGGGWQCIEPYSTMAIDHDASTCTISTPHGPVTHAIKVCSGCGFLACTCNSSGCTANPDFETSFDFSLEGGNGDVLTVPWSAEQAIRLTRPE